MSSKARPQTIKDIINVLRRFPDDSIPHYASFKSVQIAKFTAALGVDPTKKDAPETVKNIVLDVSKGSPSESASDIAPKIALTEDEALKQLKSIRKLETSFYNTKFGVGDKLRNPQGNPIYYQRLMDQLSPDKKDSGFLRYLKYFFLNK